MTQSFKDCRVAAFEGEGAVAAVDEEAKAENDGVEGDGDGVGVEADVDAGMVPKSTEVETGSGCAVSTEDGTGMVDVNSGTGESNEPFI